MTMPNPVAEVARLLPCPFCGNELYIRRGMNAYGRCETEGCFGKRLQIVPFDDPQQVAEWNTRAVSRERDTGVPEIKTALGIAHAALTAHNDWHLKQIEPQTIDGMEIVPADAYCDSTLYELTQDALHHVERMEAKLSAAPQPPTVSPDIVALTRERDQLKEELERVYKVDDQKTREINILTSENRKVYGERDQAREALTNLLADCDDYARINNLAGTWATIERARSLLQKEGG